MNRILSSFLALALCASLTGGAMASTMSAKGSAMSSHGTAMAARHGCKKGYTWVKPYMRAGKKVSGYCRKG